MDKAENVIRYYVLCNKLKDMIRTGWLDWNVKRKRIESIAEHIYGTQMLAIAIKSEYNYDIDIEKVIMMIALHELEEILIGDLTIFQITKEEKEKIGHKAVDNVLSCLSDKDKLKEYIIEFDERKTKEALFAHFCDKLECELQSKLYDEEHCVDLNNQESNKTYYDEMVQKLLKEGLSFGEMWITYWREKHNYDDNFTEVSDYALNNRISKFKEEQ